MTFTDVFIKRPVLASAVSLMLLLLGLYSLFSLQLREFPKTESTMITVSTGYPGASADVIQGFITQPLTSAIAQADGIDFISTSSTQGSSTISVYMKLNYDPNAALAEILTKVNGVQNQLPEEAQLPVITKSASDQFDLMYLGYSSDTMSPEQITDYLTRVIRPKLEAIDGVSTAEILGGQKFSMRIWLDPERMTAVHVSASDIHNALLNNNVQSAAGQTKGQLVLLNITADTDVHNAGTFENLVIKNTNGVLIRLRDVANIELGSESYDSNVMFNGQHAVFIGIATTPDSNPLTVSQLVKAVLPSLERAYPEGLTGKLVYDGSLYIEASTNEVMHTIAITGLIVIAVIFGFLGSIRTVIIPVVTMPLSIIGVCFFMYLLGYSLNLLTLLAMVLSIGLVVDDAIVVVENIYRHLEAGKTSLDAALIGAKEIASPIISMTITLAAVYAPIGFMEGLTGQLFTEFAFTLAGSVIISGFIALTLSPMMCAKVLSPRVMKERMVILIDGIFERLKNSYHHRLTNALNYRPVTAVFSIIILISCYFLAITTPTELAPKEDQSMLWSLYTAPNYANIDYMNTFSAPINTIVKNLPGMEHYFMINGMNGVNSGMAGLILKPWSERSESQETIKNIMQSQLSSIAGLQVVVFEPPALPGNNGGLPIQFVLTTTQDFSVLYTLQQQLEQAARASGLFAYVNSTLDYNNPIAHITIDRNKAGDMGINMQEISDQLSTLVGENYVNWFSMNQRSYKVIPQVQQHFRYNPSDIQQYTINSSNGGLIPLSSIASIETRVEPNALTTFQQLNSATIEGVMIPGHTIAEGLAFLRDQAQNFPKDVTYDYAGESRQLIQEGNALILTFIFALLVIYLVLAAKFESWRDPVVILVSVPMSMCGALIPLNIGLATLNIYTEIGLVTLIGLISKHGILMVEFANMLQREEQLSIREAIIKSASMRLRPILMTTFAMIFGVVPLIFATGAGARSRFDMGLVIFMGMMIGTIFTLFVVPTMYSFFAKDHAPTGNAPV